MQNSGLKIATTIPLDNKLKIISRIFVDNFWTPKQRAGHSLHEIPYMACFKSALPKFFIEKLTKPGGVVYDPFMGRGTTVIEAALLGRRVIGCDVNPLSKILTEPRLLVDKFSVVDIKLRLDKMHFSEKCDSNDPLLAFFEKDTLGDILSLKYQLSKNLNLETNKWIQMAAASRITGHSKTLVPAKGYFSVYTLPPNKSASIERQKKINKEKNNKFFKKNIKGIILNKTKSLLKDLSNSDQKNIAAADPKLYVSDCRYTPEIADESVDLIVTSPPFMNLVDYKDSNWMKLWFCDIDPNNIQMPLFKTTDAWRNFIYEALVEFHRVLKSDGHIAFEVGKVRKIDLEREVARAAINAGFKIKYILVNNQRFTKTSNIWGVKNNAKGTNTNRILLLTK